MSAQPWGEAHRREAHARMYELGAVCRRAGIVHLSAILPEDCADENTWRQALDMVFGLDAARIDREVRRVRGLAEGRLVRETTVAWRGVSSENVPITEERLRREDALAEMAAAPPPPGCKDRLVKTTCTRIRRAAR